MEEVVKKEYRCQYCGKVFSSGAALGGHTSNCKEYYIKQYGSLELFNLTRKAQAINISKTLLQIGDEKRINQERLWKSEQHTCEKCGKIMTEKYGSGRFCSMACANSRQHSQETKNKISIGVSNSTLSSTINKKYENKLQIDRDMYEISPNYCSICGQKIPFESRHNKTCGQQECLHAVCVNAGRKSVLIQGDKRRSKAEILFFDLCKQHFIDVENNAPIFNGWDADVIVHDIKYAILWNGIWHYKKIKGNQSLEQIQCRDRIKIQNIIDCGYIPYVIKDMGSFDEEFVYKQFHIFLQHIINNIDTITVND